ncbi:AcrR family transcriptional regulator [Actinoplanes lutulentus]|uniref:TetR family transcriptional regulator n=1 Tax=Actinoplanes lutulentus TaxID=1287878 RepID=A0A327ZLZ1_9ACTN|nr:TetR/AcrR family transcriptional regulator [Actinoplanes lutulentus]MBB2940837.1 AcrR family transcriptional regulator [Actinoplanes lutulentus]RAK43146.1 TetR family transcriptional regulator [Actinoplanes lutulentus]
MPARALTAKGEQTRSRIVAGAAAEIRERGVDEVRLEDVMTRTATSKSQLFHYFPDGKEELLIAVARFEADNVIDDQQPMLGELDSWESWERWRVRLIERYRLQGTHCPLSVLLGSGRRTPASQAVVDGLMERWQAAIAAGIRRMQAKGEIAAAMEADRAAAGLLAGIQGGVLLLLGTGRTDHLEAVLDMTIGALRR